MMNATKKNAKTVNKIVKLLRKKGYSIKEANIILDRTKRRIEETSKVRFEKLDCSSRWL